MRHGTRTASVCLIAVASVLCAGAMRRGAADDEPPAAPGGDPLVVRDVAVYLLSAYGTMLNERGLFQSTLPSYMLSRRPTASRDSGNQPTPAGIITFSGPAEKDVDVLLEFESGRFLTHWPPARMRTKRLLWASIDIASEASIEPAAISAEHWLSPLRDAERLFAVGNKHADRYLLYDAELPYVPHVSLKRSDDGYTVTNTGQFPVHDVVIYRPEGEGNWEVVTASQVAAADKKAEGDQTGEQNPPSGETSPGDQPASSPAPAPAATATPAPAAVEANPAPAEATPVVVAVGEAAESADVTVPAAAGGPVPADGADGAQPEGDAAAETEKPPAGTEAPAIVAGTLTAEEALNAWRGSLALLDLEPPEIEFVVSILRQQALRTDSAMLVYRLDETQIEKLMPLEVTPYPDRMFRVAIVIVQDADPDLQSRIESLVAQLGSDEWRQREAAQHDLAELGLAAKPKLEAALTSKDAEVVFRAEQLLEALKTEQ